MEPDYEKGANSTALKHSESCTSIEESTSTGSRTRDFFSSFRLQAPPENLDEADVALLEDSLKEYQVKLIALSGCIGSGLFISSATALSSAGPAGVVIGYTIIATLVFFVIQSLGELSSAYPLRGNFLEYNARFIDELWAFAMNWNYCLQWVVSIPLSLVSASLTIEYWNSPVNPAVWVAIFYVTICAINIFGVKGYGYGELVFSLIKVAAIWGFIIFGIIITAGGGSQGYIGARNWKNPGAFANGFRGVLNTLVNAAFSFAGTELVAIAAASSKDPRRALHHAMKQVFWRISIFYMLSMILLCFMVPSNDPSLLGNSLLSASPFVIAIRNAGVRGLPLVFNAVILISVLSVANALVFASYKPLVALAKAGHGPKFLMYVDKKGRPMYAIVSCLMFGLLGFVCVSPVQTTVFSWLLAISGLAPIFIWMTIAITQVRVNYACKVQGIPNDKYCMPYKAVGGDWGAYFSIVVTVLTIIAQFYIALFPIGGPSLQADSFFQAFLAAPIVIVWYVGHKLWTRNWSLYIRAQDMDVTSGRVILDVEEFAETKALEMQARKSRPWYWRWYHTWC